MNLVTNKIRKSSLHIRKEPANKQDRRGMEKIEEQQGEKTGM
jgi:hypothetical protein